MKYEIKGINPELTIKKYKIYRDKIKIVYLNGKCSYYTNNDIIKKQINNAMLEQAKVYISNKNKYTKSEKDKKRLLECIISVTIMLMGIFTLLAISSVSLMFTIINIIFVSISLGVCLISKEKHKKIIDKVVNDKPKYRLYVENSEKLEKHYNNLSNQKTIDKNNTSFINNLDKTSLKQLRNMLVQIEKEEELGYQKKLGGLK